MQESSIATLEEADRVATRIAELELEIALVNTRFDLRRQRLEQRQTEANAPLVEERDALYAKLETFASRNPNCLEKERPIPGGSYKIVRGRYSVKCDPDMDLEGESARFGLHLYTMKPDLNAIGKLLAEGEEIEGAHRVLGRDKVKVTPDKKLTASRMDEAKKAESARIAEA